MTEIAKHANPFSQAALDSAIERYATANAVLPRGAIVLYSDIEQGGALEFGVMVKVGDQFSFRGNLQRSELEKRWKGHAEVAYVW